MSITTNRNTSSSNIASYSYDNETSVLLVEFKNGSRYEYLKVPPAIFEEMRQAPSAGSFLHARVKGYYDNRKL